MLVYKALKRDFMESVDNDRIADEINQKVYDVLGKHTPKNEYLSWKNSMVYMYKVLNDSEIADNTVVAIEFNIPQTSKRVDFMICGENDNKEPHVVIIELKQWEKLNEVDGEDGTVETFVGKGMHKTVHPSYQAWSYAQIIRDYNSEVQDKTISLSPCAYLHNYERITNDPIDAQRYKVYLKEAPAFTRGEVEKLRDFIKKSVKYGTKEDLLYYIDNGRIRPSKSLQDSIANMIKGNQEFTLIDDQKVTYETIIKLSKQSKIDKKKRTIIAIGGPGTGKTVIAINVLARLTNDDQFVQYVSKNQAPRYVYLKKLKGVVKGISIDNMFKGSGMYCEAPANGVDTIIADEAHRLNEKSGMFKNLGENQIKEIINASVCSVFFIDENQKVTLNDIGSVDEIEKWAKYYNSEITTIELNSQFRCNGSDGYMAFLDDLLEIRETANTTMAGADYDLKVFDDPNELKKAIFDLNKQNHKSRILAGYCWNWITEGKNDTNVHDIQIGDFSMSWNLGNTNTYALDDNSINEVGCIHTSQGLEFDYVGVIIGEDLTYKEGHVVTDYTKRASTDASLKGIKTLIKKDPDKAFKLADQIIRNTYRTLMTRGMKGCYIYCCNKNLSEYIKFRIKGNN